MTRSFQSETLSYILDVRFTDTLVVDVWGDGTERYKIGFMSCYSDKETDLCATTGASGDRGIRMSAAPL